MDAMQIVGACLLVAPFVLFFAAFTIMEGFWVAVSCFAFCAALFGTLCLGTFLLNGGAS